MTTPLSDLIIRYDMFDEGLEDIVREYHRYRSEEWYEYADSLIDKSPFSQEINKAINNAIIGDTDGR